jgi:hypothetical protein
VGLTAAKIKRDEEVERRLSEIESSLVHEADLDERDGGEVLPFALRSRGVGGGVPTVEGITAVIRITAVILIMDTAIPYYCRRGWWGPRFGIGLGFGW